MATRYLPLLLLLLLLPASLFSFAVGIPYQAPEKTEEKVVVMEGIVYCQNCTHVGSWSLAGAKPLPSAKVSISCKDHKNRVSFYKAVQANGEGFFYAPLAGLKDYHVKRPTDACLVRLLSSPDARCNVLTNVNYGIEGARLQGKNKRITTGGYNAEIYAAGPLAFRPAHCPPRTLY
ncbi:non-classical arabinogalactan protein 30 [Phoenix dactylifera]|uniref:Non-classical arabinogalactan protein 30 n=1 Tax=Phoenix dactylifera TaxID=42345 RepID=A0A8B7C915_PHODC|nr:non-classical arabinogalactan protein 30 [Phoenix dactylifera]